MAMMHTTAKGTQEVLMRTLLHNKTGQTVEGLSQALAISRNAVRQHLTALERDGLVAKGARQPSGGRPEQLYVLTLDGHEKFPRQYSWISELLLQALENRSQGELGDELERMGETVGKTLRTQLGEGPDAASRVKALATLMAGLGYEAQAMGDSANPQIEAQNCVFHKLAFKRPEICRFDLAMMSAATGSDIEHSHCMAQGAACCTFAFHPR